MTKPATTLEGSLYHDVAPVRSKTEPGIRRFDVWRWWTWLQRVDHGSFTASSSCCSSFSAYQWLNVFLFRSPDAAATGRRPVTHEQRNATLTKTRCGWWNGDGDCALIFDVSNTFWPLIRGCQPLGNAATGSPTTSSSTIFAVCLSRSRRSSNLKPSIPGTRPLTSRHIGSCPAMASDLNRPQSKS